MRTQTELIASRPGPVQPGWPAPKEMTFQDLWDLLSRRKGLVITIFASVIVAAGLLFAIAERMYMASAEIQVQKETADALSLDTMMGQDASSGDAVESNITLQTEAQILESDSLALSVIKTLDLEHTKDFRPRWNPLGWVLSRLAPAGIPDPKNVALEDAPARRARVVKIFQSHLKIKPVPGTRLITVQYFSSDPRTTAAVVNLLVQDLIDYNFATRHDATQQASSWLAGQLGELRKRSENLQTQVVNLQRGSGVFTMGQADKDGREQVYTPALDRLQQATAQLSEAQSSRILKGALYQVVKDGDPELISGLAGNSTLSGSTSGLTGSLTLLQNLRSQEAQTEAQLNELSDKFGSAYPKIGEVQANLESTRAAIRGESARIAARVKNDYAVAQQVENNDRAVFEQQKAQAEALNDKAVGYEIVRQEATESRNLYESLLGRLKEADLVAGMHSTNITLVDRARVPARPAKPDILVYGGAGVMGGVLLGVCAGLFRHATDSRIQEFAELNSLGHEAPIAFLPHHTPAQRKRLAGPKQPLLSAPSLDPIILSPGTARERAMVAAVAPRSAYTEALRTLRTTLMQSASPPKVVLVTSSIPGEGKSMLSVNLAILYAQRGKRVLLVDGDLRTPILHTRLALSRENGLADLLTAEDLSTAGIHPIRVQVTSSTDLEVLSAGSESPYPTELLASDQMASLMERWRAEYDYIFIDGAPLLPVTDSAVLGRCVDYTLVVVRHKLTDRRSLERTCQILHAQGIRNTGLVLNGVRTNGGAQFRYYGYNPSTYYGGSTHA